MTEEEIDLIGAIKSKKKELNHKFPDEAYYGSEESLWMAGFNAGLVSELLYNAAKRYYGRIWSYVGD